MLTEDGILQLFCVNYDFSVRISFNYIYRKFIVEYEIVYYDFRIRKLFLQFCNEFRNCHFVAPCEVEVQRAFRTRAPVLGECSGQWRRKP